jgi:hypothetical protein
VNFILFCNVVVFFSEQMELGQVKAGFVVLMSSDALWLTLTLPWTIHAFSHYTLLPEMF